MARIAVAAGTPTAAAVGAEVARAGGNAVDVAVAATFATWVCEPGITALGSGGFVCLWPEAGAPVVIDGFASRPRVDGVAPVPVTMAYGGGTRTRVGPGSVATPGALAAVADAWRRWGSRPWSTLVAPAAALARTGFPLPTSSYEYFKVSGEAVFGGTPGVRQLHERPDGSARGVGETVTIPELATTLERIAHDGAEDFYTGALGAEIGAWLEEQGSGVRAEDLASYETQAPVPLTWSDGTLTIATVPGPSVGGSAFLELVELTVAHASGGRDGWTPEVVAHFATAMGMVFDHRDEDLAAWATRAGADMPARLERRVTDGRRILGAASTSHVSSVAADGMACSITTSTGYGAGIAAPGTGVLLNNMLGEHELLPVGPEVAAPGARLPSNMAPVLARGEDGWSLALGAAGSSRIVSALAQVWINRTHLGLPLAEAIGHDRCHVEHHDGKLVLACEPGVDTSMVVMPKRPFDTRHMYFGGVQAAERTADGTLVAAGDPRRDGAAQVV